jgi:hypothetical protein
MDWEPEHPRTVPSHSSFQRNCQTPAKRSFPALQPTKTMEFVVSAPPSPLDDWARFKNDITTEMTPITTSPTLMHQEETESLSVSVESVRPHTQTPLPVISSEAFRIGYAFSALLRILAVVATLTSRAGATATSRSEGFLAEGPSIIEMISSAGSGMAQRQRAQVSLPPSCCRYLASSLTLVSTDDDNTSDHRDLRSSATLYPSDVPVDIGSCQTHSNHRASGQQTRVAYLLEDLGRVVLGGQRCSRLADSVICTSSLYHGLNIAL